jgi:putative PIN family toxin of toxin-antitoxin system
MRMLFDTDVVVAGLRSDRGASRQLILAALERRIVLIASVPMMLEYEAVLVRPDQLAATGLSIEDTCAVLDALASVMEPVAFHFHWRPQLTDPADEMVLETAVNGRADRLVTFNARHLREAARRFGIRAILPRDAWHEIREAGEEKYEKK